MSLDLNQSFIQWISHSVLFDTFPTLCASIFLRGFLLCSLILFLLPHTSEQSISPLPQGSFRWLRAVWAPSSPCPPPWQKWIQQLNQSGIRALTWIHLGGLIDGDTSCTWYPHISSILWTRPAEPSPLLSLRSVFGLRGWWMFEAFNTEEGGRRRRTNKGGEKSRRQKRHRGRSWARKGNAGMLSQLFLSCFFSFFLHM